MIHPRTHLLLWTAATVALLMGCSGDSETPPPTPSGGGGAAGAGGGAAHGPGGWGWGGCPPGEQPLDDGTCLPAGEGAGIPPDGCAEGFEPDDDGGCSAILPAAACAAGQLALPGETQCREVAPCGDGTWGDIPVDASTVYVDGSYAGGNSDGSEAAPWTSIQQAVGAAPAGALVAVAAGSYPENVVVIGKAIRLWGRCPGLVEIAGTSAAAAALSLSSADGAEIHDLAITGLGRGLLSHGTGNVSLDRVWIHDTGDQGILAAEGTAITLRASLVEAAHGFGAYVVGATMDVEATVVRDTAPDGTGDWGWGILLAATTAGERSAGTVLASLIERNRGAGVVVSGSTVTVEATLIRDTEVYAASQRGGDGLDVGAAPSSGERSVVAVQSSVVEGNRKVGVSCWGSELTMDATVVRDTRSEEADHRTGHGVQLTDSEATSDRAEALLRNCLVVRNHEMGVLVGNSDAVIESTVVRDTLPSDANQRYGRGIMLQGGMVEGALPSTGIIRTSVVSNSHEVGLGAQGGQLTLESSRVEGTHPQASDQGFGRGVTLDLRDGHRAQGTIRWSVIEDNHESGLFVGSSDVTVESSVIGDTQPIASGGYAGVGIMLQHIPGPGNATAEIRRALIRNNHRAGIGALGSELTVEDTLIERTLPDQVDGGFGDAIVIVSHVDAPASGVVRASRFADNARAGLAIFAANATVDSSDFTCNAFDLNGEQLSGRPFVFDNLGGNVCGCVDSFGDCTMLSAGLEPPSPL